MADGTSALHFSMSTLPYLLPVLRCCDSASAFLVSAVGSYALHGCGCSSAAPEEDPSLAVSGYAPALHFCPHVDANVIALPYGEETKNIEPDDCQCAKCDNREENWLCLTCHSIHCGRFASAHARRHWEESGHCIAMGFGDLSFWCYQCDSYLHHLSMAKVYAMYRTLHVMKFGEPAVEVPEFTADRGRAAQSGSFKIVEGDVEAKREEDGGERGTGGRLGIL